MSSRTWLLLVLALGLFPGCHTMSSGEAPPVPPEQTQGREGGQLLQTGSIQLGPGVARNDWRWEGDGKWGF